MFCLCVCLNVRVYLILIAELRTDDDVYFICHVEVANKPAKEVEDTTGRRTERGDGSKDGVVAHVIDDLIEMMKKKEEEEVKSHGLEEVIRTKKNDTIEKGSVETCATKKKTTTEQIDLSQKINDETTLDDAVYATE